MTDSVLFTNVSILDSTGAQPYPGEVLVTGDRIAEVRKGTGGDLPRDGSQVIDGQGATLTSGLADAHTHFTWNNGDLNALGTMGVEEHTLHSTRSAKIYIDHG